MPRAAAPPPPLERSVLRDTLKVCRELMAAHPGLHVERQNSGALRDTDGRLVRLGTPGSLDLRGWLPGGRHLEIELKRPGNAPTEAQWARLLAVNAAGGAAFWSVDAEQVRHVLARLCGGARIEVDAARNQFVADGAGPE